MDNFDAKKKIPKEANKVKRCGNVKQMYVKDVDGVLLTGKVSVCENLTSEVARLILGNQWRCEWLTSPGNAFR